MAAKIFLTSLGKMGYQRSPCGGVAEWLMAADCKSARVSVREFESLPLHHRKTSSRHLGDWSQRGKGFFHIIDFFGFFISPLKIIDNWLKFYYYNLYLIGGFQNEVQHLVRDWNDGLFYG